LKSRRTLLMVVALLALGMTLALPCQGYTHPNSNQMFNVGFTILESQYAQADARETITVAIWYPTSGQTRSYIYNNGFRSQVAPDAPPASGGALPLITFYHGGYSTGIQSLCLTEHLASRGFIVAAPDFIDTIPPGFVEPAAFERIRGTQGVKDPVAVLRIVGEFARAMNADREMFYWYMERFRLGKARFVIDVMLQEGTRRDSLFYGVIDRDAIGISGHSLGGLTTLGLIGAHPREELRDPRVKAALALSSGVYPYEDRISRIQTPLMTMHGDHDEPMNPDYPRGLLYERANPPKYYLVLRDATHFTFGNTPCQQYSTISDCQASDPRVRAINSYSSAFFEKYLKNSTEADRQLSRTDPILLLYEKDVPLHASVTHATSTTTAPSKTLLPQPVIIRLAVASVVVTICGIVIIVSVVVVRHRRSLRQKIISSHTLHD